MRKLNYSLMTSIVYFIVSVSVVGLWLNKNIQSPQKHFPDSRSVLLDNPFLQDEEPIRDVKLELVGIYIDSTSYPNASHEIILYKQGGVLTGLWSQYFSEEKQGYPYGAYPLENVQFGSDGSLKFSVLWDMYFRGEGRVRKHHYFTGQLLNDVIQGEFTSDWYVLSPPPIKAVKKTRLDLKQNENDYVLVRQRKASEYIADLDRVLKCQEERQKLPGDPIRMIGFWSKIGSNGEHEWGYDVVLFTVGNVYRGWIEDYSGLVGDGGIRYIMQDIQYDKGAGQLDFKDHAPYAGTQYKALLRKKRLLLKDFNGKKISLLYSVKSPPVDQVWNQYQELVIECK